MTSLVTRWGTVLRVVARPKLSASVGMAAAILATCGVDKTSIVAFEGEPDAIFKIVGVASTKFPIAGSAIFASIGLNHADAVLIYKEFDGGHAGDGATTNPGSGSTSAGQVVVQFVSPQTVWHLVHNLGKYPDIQVLTADGTVANAETRHLDVNVAQISFGSPTAGAAVLS